MYFWEKSLIEIIIENKSQKIFILKTKQTSYFSFLLKLKTPATQKENHECYEPTLVFHVNQKLII